jgi:hypothetical protein
VAADRSSTLARCRVTGGHIFRASIVKGEERAESDMEGGRKRV